MHVPFAARLRLAPHTTTKESLIDKWMNDNSCLTTNLYHSILPFDDQFTDGMHLIFKWMKRSSQQLTHHNSSNLLHNNTFNINV